VVGVLEHGDTRATGVLAGDLDAVLDGLRARVHEQGLVGVLGGGPGHVLGEVLGDLHVRLVGGHGEQGVGDLVQLLGGGRDDGPVGVTDGGHADAAADVDEVIAVDVDQDRVVRALDVDGQHAVHAGRHDRAAALVDLS
jgi:hypothetical protein